MEYTKYFNLALNASEAAVDISNIVFGNNIGINYPNIREISEYLYNISQNNKIDTTEGLMLAEAVWSNRKDWKGKREDYLKFQIRLFAKDLELLTQLSTERQEILRDACVDLSKSSLNYSRQLREARRHLVA